MIFFSFLLLGILALVVSVLLGIPSALVASRIARKRALKHRPLIVFLAAITPALFIGMEIVFGLIGSIYISEKKGVDMGFGDYWKAPLTESHYISAVDMPEAATISSRETNREYDGFVRHLWIDDRIYAACSTADHYSLYAFHAQDSEVDTLLFRADSLRYAEVLQERNLDPDTALAPDEYFNRSLKEAHKIEEPLRHALATLIIVALWVLLIRLTQKKNTEHGPFHRRTAERQDRQDPGHVMSKSNNMFLDTR